MSQEHWPEVDGRGAADGYHDRVRRIHRVLSLAGVVVALAGCDLQQTPADGSGSSGAGGVAPPISGATTDGSAVSAAATQKQVTVVDFWGSWCGPCRAEQPELNTLYSRYHPRGVVFIGVDMRDDNASANAYRHDFNVAYPSIDDSSSSIAGAYNVTAPPELVVIDRTGHIAGRYLGTTVSVSAALDQALS